MSKSKVHITKSFRILETSKEEENLNSNLEKPQRIKIKKVKSRNAYIYKLLHPFENVYPKCEHANGQILNRMALTHVEYLNFLSSPKQVNEKPLPEWIRKTITPSNSHVNSLAKPNEATILNTLNTYRHLFTFRQIENLIAMINLNGNQSSAEIIKQTLINRKRKIKTQKCEIKKLRRKIEQCEKFEKLSWEFLKNLNIDDLLIQEDDDLKQIAECILTRLCEIKNLKIQDVSLKNSAEGALMHLANTLAQKIVSVRKQQQNGNEESDCKKKILNIYLENKNRCLSINKPLENSNRDKFVNKISVNRKDEKPKNEENHETDEIDKEEIGDKIAEEREIVRVDEKDEIDEADVSSENESVAKVSNGEEQDGEDIKSDKNTVKSKKDKDQEKSIKKDKKNTTKDQSAKESTKTEEKSRKEKPKTGKKKEIKEKEEGSIKEKDVDENNTVSDRENISFQHEDQWEINWGQK